MSCPTAEFRSPSTFAVSAACPVAVFFDPVFFKATFDYYTDGPLPLTDPQRPTARRIWLVTRARGPDARRMLQHFTQLRYRKVDERKFRGLGVYELMK